MTAKGKKKKIWLPRKLWSRSPVEKVHTTGKGAKGYQRPRVKKDVREEVED